MSSALSNELLLFILMVPFRLSMHVGTNFVKLLSKCVLLSSCIGNGVHFCYYKNADRVQHRTAQAKRQWAVKYLKAKKGKPAGMSNQRARNIWCIRKFTGRAKHLCLLIVLTTKALHENLLLPSSVCNIMRTHTVK